MDQSSDASAAREREPPSPDETKSDCETSAAERYPSQDLPFVASAMPEDERFLNALEDFLLGYGHNTARAYLADLVDIYEWAQDKQIDFWGLSETGLKPYIARMRRRDYAEGTIRRRLTAWRQFSNHRLS